MARFSERMGLTPKPLVQLNDMNSELRNSLWNIILLDMGGGEGSPNYSQAHRLAEPVALQFAKIPLDEPTLQNPYHWLRDFFFGLEWYRTYELIEFLREVCYSHHPGFVQAVNTILEREQSGYRFVSDVAEVESAAGATGPAGQHIRTSLELLAKRPDPDHRNAIKEAISAVESTVKQFAGSSKSFAKAIEELSRKVELHGSLKTAFKNLYGYTSNEDGIRHAILEQKEIGFDEAKYMIVVCSAFINFLISKANAAGLLSSE